MIYTILLAISSVLATYTSYATWKYDDKILLIVALFLWFNFLGVLSESLKEKMGVRNANLSENE